MSDIEVLWNVITSVCTRIYVLLYTHLLAHTYTHTHSCTSTHRSLSHVYSDGCRSFFFFFKMHINWVRGDATNVSLDWELSWNYPFIFPPLRKSARLRPRVQPKSSRVRLCLTETTWHTGWGNWTVRGRSRSDEEKKKKERGV